MLTLDRRFVKIFMQFTSKKMTNALLKIMLTDYLQMVYRQGTRVGYTQDQIKALEDYLETLDTDSNM